MPYVRHRQTDTPPGAEFRYIRRQRLTISARPPSMSHGLGADDAQYAKYQEPLVSETYIGWWCSDPDTWEGPSMSSESHVSITK